MSDGASATAAASPPALPPVSRVQQWLLIVVSVIGAALFATVFAFTYSVPGWVEDLGQAFIEREASERIEQTIGAIDGIEVPDGDSNLGRLARSLLEKNEDRIEALKQALRDKVAEQFAASLAEIRDLDCECRAYWENRIRSGFEFELDFRQATNRKIVDLIQGNYMTVVEELRRDVRIFSGSNTVVFLALILVAVAKRRAVRHLMLPAILLMTSTVICSYFYIFEQDWLFTLIFRDFTGFAYLAYLGIVFATLVDVVFNSARVTTAIVNAFLEAVGAAFSLVPC